MKVVDLCGRVPRYSHYDADSLQMVFSSSKTVAALVIAYLVNQDRLSYDDPVSKHWPEFSQHGKADITVKQLLKHDAGLAFFQDKKKITREMLKPGKEAELSDFLASAKPAWTYMKKLRPGERIYHSTTRGFFLNELCKRVDVNHRTIGKLLQQEIIPKVNQLLPEGETVRLTYSNLTEDLRKSLVHYRFAPIAKTAVKHFYKEMKKKLVPREEDRFVATLQPELVMETKKAKKELKKFVPKKLIMRSFHAVQFNALYSTDDHYQYEAPSFNLLANARSFCALGNAFLFAPKEQRIMNDVTLKRLFEEPLAKVDAGVMDRTTFVNGGFAKFEEVLYPSFLHHFYGWQGLGGSVFAFSVEHELVVSYTPCQLSVLSFGGFLDKRCVRIVKALMECLEENENTGLLHDTPTATSHVVGS